jgi:hypothetical protein
MVASGALSLDANPLLDADYGPWVTPGATGTATSWLVTVTVSPLAAVNVSVFVLSKPPGMVLSGPVMTAIPWLVPRPRWLETPVP